MSSIKQHPFQPPAKTQEMPSGFSGLKDQITGFAGDMLNTPLNWMDDAKTPKQKAFRVGVVAAGAIALGAILCAAILAAKGGGTEISMSTAMPLMIGATLIAAPIGLLANHAISSIKNETLRQGIRTTCKMIAIAGVIALLALLLVNVFHGGFVSGLISHPTAAFFALMVTGLCISEAARYFMDRQNKKPTKPLAFKHIQPISEKDLYTVQRSSLQERSQLVLAEKENAKARKARRLARAQRTVPTRKPHTITSS